MTARAWRGVTVAALLAAPVLAPEAAPQAAGANRPPAIEKDTPACVRPGARPKVCAYVLDDKAIARVSAVFRAGGTRPYYWTPMKFDGARYCGWLPRPQATTTSIEYYVEAFDDEFETSRSRGETVAVAAECAAPQEPAPTDPSPVAGTAPGQPPVPAGFDPETVLSAM